MTDTFPRSFNPSRILDSDFSIERPFLVAAMCTAEYADRAGRLAASCRVAGVSFVIYQVPEVHRSISPRGGTDDAYAKGNFIHFLLNEYHRPILYVDADCVLASYPTVIEETANHGFDFAIYNWLADEHTDCFVPVEMRMPSGEFDRTRFYHFSHAIDHYASDQLICSGAVQFYADTAPARLLLAQWWETIRAFSNAADDPCLDFAFNNFACETKVTASWLPKTYARYAWWIYAKPVIDHPEFPNSGGFTDIPEIAGRKRFYSERTEIRQTARLFPRDGIIDTAERIILKPVDGRLQPVSRTDQNFWLTR